MSKYDFLLEIEEILKTRPEIKGASVSSNVYMKNNDTECYGITVFTDPERISPVFYIDSFYDDYCRKKLTIEEIGDKILESYRSVVPEAQAHSNISLDFEDCKDNIAFRLVSLKKNKRFLENTPHVIYLDLAVYFVVIYKADDDGIESIKVTYELIDSWEKTSGDLLKLAKVNTPRLFPMVVKTLSDVLCIENLGFDLLLLSNSHFVYGASVMLYVDEMKRIAKVLEEDFYVIPSSVHEVLIMPKSKVDDIKEINDMIRSINDEHLISTDILSDRAYLYDSKENRFHF